MVEKRVPLGTFFLVRFLIDNIFDLAELAEAIVFLAAANLLKGALALLEV
jgi:hypothetical protein